MASLLDPEAEINIDVFNETVQKMNNGDQASIDILSKFCKRQDAWTIAGPILQSNSSVYSKFQVLLILQDLVKFRWQLLSDENQEEIRAFITELVISWVDAEADQRLLNQADIVLVDIIMKDWPIKMPTIITDLLASTSASTRHCFNNFSILQFLCENTFGNDNESVTSSRLNEVTLQLSALAPTVFELIQNIFVSPSIDPQIVSTVLKAFKYFVRWISPDLLISSEFFQYICSTFLSNELLFSEVLDVIDQIFNSNDLQPQLKDSLPPIISYIVSSLSSIFPPGTDFQYLSSSNTQSIKIFTETITHFLCKFSEFLEKPEFSSTMTTCLQWICALSEVEDEDIFRTCCEFWSVILPRYAKEGHKPLSILPSIYEASLPSVCRILINRMQRPDEVIITEDAAGNVVRESQKNTLNLDHFANMKKALSSLSQIDLADTIGAVKELLSKLHFRWDSSIYNSMCWSVGNLTMNVTSEISFLSPFLTDLLTMCDSTSDANTRAIIASGIMYVCSQHPKFVSHLQEFLRKITFKLFDFMQQEVPGIKEMAVDSFKAIATKCKSQFCASTSGVLLIDEVITSFSTIVANLTTPLIVAMFDAVSQAIQGFQKNDDRGARFHALVAHLNSQWGPAYGGFNVDSSPSLICFIINCYTVLCDNLSAFFPSQMAMLIPQLMDIFQASSIITSNGNVEAHCKAVKAAVIGLFTSFASKCESDPILPQVGTIVEDFNSAEEMRVPEVLVLVSAVVQKSPNSATEVFSSIFQKAMEMISNEFDSNPTFRLPFYQMVFALLKYCPKYIAGLDADSIDLLSECINWGSSHPSHDICVLALQATVELFAAAQGLGDETFMQNFLELVLYKTMYHIFSIMTDTIHKSSVGEQIGVLAKLIIMSCGQMNALDLTKYVMPIFPYREFKDIQAFMEKLLGCANDMKTFQNVVKDLLITSRSYAIADPALDQTVPEEKKDENPEDVQ